MSGFRSLIRLIVLSLLLVVLAACQQLPMREPAQSDPDSDSPPAAVAPDLAQVMQLLQEGDAERAEVLLDGILNERPADSIARLLLAQIQQAPEALLGNQFQEILVQPGDSLSALAARHAGNGLLFFSLARLNNVQHPRLLRPGQKLLVPVLSDSPPADTLPEPGLSDPVQDHSDSTALTQAVNELLDDDRQLQAYSLLLNAAGANELDQHLKTRLASVAAELAETALADNQPERALQLLDKAATGLGDLAGQGAFVAVMSRAQARTSLAKIGQMIEAADYEAARATFIAQPGNVADGPYQLEYDAIRSTLIEHFHVRALSAWRSQDIDQAVSLWEQVLEIDPEFEPGRVYLERGYRMQEQLEKLPEE